MTKYEFVWGAPPAALAGWQRITKSGQFEIEIGIDRIVARTNFTATPEPELYKEAAAIVENLARAIAFQEKRTVTLTPGHVTRTSDSGSAEITIAVGSAMVTAVGKAHAVVEGLDGKVVFDSAAAEFNAAKDLAERAARSPRLRQMLDEIQKFYADPEKKLAPIYNIVKAADTHFVGRKATRDALKISKAKLDEVTGICDNPEILNARHPGEGRGPKRPATPQELQLCQEIAETIIRNFAVTV